MENLKRKIEKIQMLFTANQMFRLVDKDRYNAIELELSEALKLCNRQEDYECDHFVIVSKRCFCGAVWDGISCNNCGFDASEVDIY